MEFQIYYLVKYSKFFFLYTLQGTFYEAGKVQSPLYVCWWKPLPNINNTVVEILKKTFWTLSEVLKVLEYGINTVMSERVN